MSNIYSYLKKIDFVTHHGRADGLVNSYYYFIIIIIIIDTIKQAEMKEKIQKEYLRKTRKLLETKLNSRNLIKGINTWAVPLVRYSGPFLK